MKKCILFLLLLGVTSTKPFSISVTDTAYWVGTITVLYWVNQRVARMETLQEAHVKADNARLPKDKQNTAVDIPPRPTLMDSAQELYTFGRYAVNSASNTASGLRQLSHVSDSNTN